MQLDELATQRKPDAEPTTLVAGTMKQLEHDGQELDLDTDAGVFDREHDVLPVDLRTDVDEPPASVNFTALWNKFDKTCTSRT